MNALQCSQWQMQHAGKVWGLSRLSLKVENGKWYGRATGHGRGPGGRWLCVVFCVVRCCAAEDGRTRMAIIGQPLRTIFVLVQ